MAAFEVLALDPTTPQIRAPGAADTYSFPRNVSGNITLASGGVFQVPQANRMFGSTNSGAAGFGMSGNLPVLLHGNSATEGVQINNNGAFSAVIAADAANTLAQRNGTNWQAFNIYSTYTDALNYERIEIRQSGASWFIGSNSFGTGPGNRNINLTANGQLIFGANGGSNWLINTSGHFFANTDNTSDIGASAANRPRTVYAGTSVLAPYVRTSTAYTVATLPAAATAGAGARAFVTDATATTFLSTVAGGGANKVPVVSDGTNWLIG